MEILYNSYIYLYSESPYKNILDLRYKQIAIVEYSPMATFVNGVEQIYQI